jgi:hypothetical protein
MKSETKITTYEKFNGSGSKDVFWDKTLCMVTGSLAMTLCIEIDRLTTTLCIVGGMLATTLSNVVGRFAATFCIQVGRLATTLYLK